METSILITCKVDIRRKNYYNYSAQSFVYTHGLNTENYPGTAIEAAVQQRVSDTQNTAYRKTNRATFMGFTAYPNGWRSSLQWSTYKTP